MLKNKESLIKADDEDTGDDSSYGMHEFNSDDDSGEDEAAKWLKEQEAGPKKPDAPAPASEQSASKKAERVYSKDWAPRADYSAKQRSAIDTFMADGYSHREAERLADAHQGPSDFNSALRSGINPDHPSDKMLEQLRPLAKEWINKKNAMSDQDVNPMKHAVGHIGSTYNDRMSHYNDAFNNFLQSDDIKTMSPRDRHSAVNQWKREYKTNNPHYMEDVAALSQAHGKLGEAAQAIKEKNLDISEHISRGGVSGAPTVSEAEAFQHLGSGKSSEGMYTGTTVKDPLASFASQNPEYVKKLNTEQQERLKRMQNIKASTKQAAPAAPETPQPSPRPAGTTVIRRPGKKEGQ